MELTVLLFASYAETLGTDRVHLVLEPGTTVQALVDRLRAVPGGEQLPARPLVAVNRRYSPYDQLIAPGDEVAVIPPVAGG